MRTSPLSLSLSRGFTSRAIEQLKSALDLALALSLSLSFTQSLPSFSLPPFSLYPSRSLALARYIPLPGAPRAPSSTDQMGPFLSLPARACVFPARSLALSLSSTRRLVSARLDSPWDYNPIGERRGAPLARSLSCSVCCCSSATSIYK